MSAFKMWTTVLALLLVAATLGWWHTKPPSARSIKRSSAALTSAALVDESNYATALRLSGLATTAEEQLLSLSALRIADHELALAFNAALRDVEAHPPTLSPDAIKIQERLQKSQMLLDGDQQRVTQLGAALANAPASQKDALNDELQLAQSQLDLDKDEVEEANQDLLAAGGNPQERIETMVQEHDAQAKARAAAPPAAASTRAGRRGSLGNFREWLQLREKSQQLAAAADIAQQKAQALSSQRATLAASLEDTKGGIAELSQHTKSAKLAAPPAASGSTAASAPPAASGPPAASAPTAASSPTAHHSHEDAATLLNQTKLITANQKLLTLLERQGTDERQLAGVYQQWATLVSVQANTLAHQCCSTPSSSA